MKEAVEVRMAKILSVCKSEKKGTRKDDIGQGYFRINYGLENDAHADPDTHRQVSLMAIESIEKMRQMGVDVGPGDFGENLTTEGMDLVSLPVGTEISVGDDVKLEITQIGKECHTKCAIFYSVGRCIMPEEGVFSRVLHGGTIKTGDEIRVS